MKKQTLCKLKLMQLALPYDETATLEKLVGILTVGDSRMTSKLYILRTKVSEHILVTISDAVTYNFDNEEELQKFLSKKFERFGTDKEMWQAFTGMDDETWEEWNK